MNSDDASYDRRRFLQLMGFGISSAALALPAKALAQARSAGSAPADSAKASAPAAPAGAAAPATPPPISEDARSLAEIVRRRYGQHLTPDQIEAITRELDGRIQSGRRLRDLKLANGDEPDFVFHA